MHQLMHHRIAMQEPSSGDHVVLAPSPCQGRANIQLERVLLPAIAVS